MLLPVRQADCASQESFGQYEQEIMRHFSSRKRFPVLPYYFLPQIYPLCADEIHRLDSTGQLQVLKYCISLFPFQYLIITEHDIDNGYFYLNPRILVYIPILRFYYCINQDFLLLQTPSLILLQLVCFFARVYSRFQ